MRHRPQNAKAKANKRHPEDTVSLDEVLDLLQGIAKDYASIGSIFSYEHRGPSNAHTANTNAGPGYYIKQEEFEAMQQELAALKDSNDLFQRDVRNSLTQRMSQPPPQQQYVPPWFENQHPQQQVQIQSRQDNTCFYCKEPGHIVRDCAFTKDHTTKGKVKLDANGNIPWNQLPKEPAHLLPKDRVEQQGKVQNLYVGTDEDFDRAIWELQVAPPETSNYMTTHGNDDAQMWMEHCKQVEQWNIQWQKVVHQQQMQAKPVEPVIHQLINAVLTVANVVTLPVLNQQSLQEQVNFLKVELAKVAMQQANSGF